jgi:hypothetical protein
MADRRCTRCGSFLNAMGTCLSCHPTGRTRADRPEKKPWSGNKKKDKS